MKITHIFDVTPMKFQCMVGACPSIFESAQGVLIIGKRLAKAAVPASVWRKIGKDEALILVPKDLLKL
jgi:hypothetical protein